MTLEEFQSFVGENSSRFRGVHPESNESLQRAEHSLRCSLPATLKWLLGTCGYSHAAGIGSLEDAVATTLDCRAAFALPERYIVLNDWGDGGAVYLDLESERITWGDGSDLHSLAEGHLPPEGNDVYADYPAWVASRLEVECEEEE